jgi:hypothetical protein
MLWLATFAFRRGPVSKRNASEPSELALQGGLGGDEKKPTLPRFDVPLQHLQKGSLIPDA